MIISYLLLLIGFVCLTAAAGYLVDGSAALARRTGVSDLVIGLTVVAFGTSTPELFVNLTAAINGNTDIALGNVVGSNIANILLILGVSGLIYPLRTTQSTVWKEIPFSLLAAVVLGIMASDSLLGGTISIVTRGDGLVLLCFFVIFLYYSTGIALSAKDIDQYALTKPLSLPAASFRIVTGLAGLTLGGWLIVENATRIASHLGLSDAFIGVTIVAVGTSLPELATSAMAAYRKNADIAVGNVVGSNIFNIFFILGLTATVRPISSNHQSMLDMVLMILASFLLFLSMFTGRKRALDRWEGFCLLALYVAFVILKVFNY